MKRLSFAALLCTGAVSLCVLALGGFSIQRARSASFPYQENDKLITLDGERWESQAEFISRGGYCQSPDLDLNTMYAVEKRLKRYRQRIQAVQSPQRGVSAVSTFVARPAGSVTVPVWFHVILAANGSGNVTDAQLQAQINVLNVTYAGRDIPPAGVAPLDVSSPTPFRFVLAGVDRTTNASWYSVAQSSANETAMKSALRRGGAETLNIYLCAPAGTYGATLGWSSWPVEYASKANMDGLVILNSTVPGGSKAPYNLGKTIVHESGHWLGLYHTFQGGCSTRNDFVDDTPAERTAHYGIFPPQPDSCTYSYTPGKDPVDNFMDYGDDAYIVRFTPGQAAAMDSNAAVYRGL